VQTTAHARHTQSGWKASKGFFFEKKKQKTFAPWVFAGGSMVPTL
jgi:hypothetical protein